MYRSGSAPLVAPRRHHRNMRLPPLSALATPPPPLVDTGASSSRSGSLDGPPVVKRRSRRTLSGCSVETVGSTAAPTTCTSSQVGCCFPSECSTPVTSVGLSSLRRTSSTSALKRQEKRKNSQLLSPPRSQRLLEPAPARTSALAWVKGKALGAGSFGTVFKALDPATKQIFAVKEVQFEDGSCSSKQRERLNVELSICQNLRHPHIVSYLGHDYTGQSLCIYLEYVPGGSMACVLSEFGALEGKTLRKATLGMLEGLDFLHTRSVPVVHRDLKGANLLVDLDMTVKLTDFGCSKWSSETRSFTTLGSVPWMAPEVIDQKQGYGRKADIWSFGCTVIEMATAEKPWGNGAFDNMMFALNHIANSEERPAVPEKLPLECRDLIKQCTQRVQSQRPTTTELLQHDFLAPSPGRVQRQPSRPM